MNKRIVGNEKEELAALYLTKSGYEILDRNYWCRFGELDIVARDRKYLCFVEVKYRSNSRYGAPDGLISDKKKMKICMTSQFYMKEKNFSADTPVRYDVVLLIGKKIQLIQNAFYYV